MMMRTFQTKCFIVFTILAAVQLSTEAQSQDRPKVEIIPNIPHTLPVNVVAFSADGELVLLGSEDGTAKIWNASSGRLLRTFQAHPSGVNAVAFLPDQRLLTSGWSFEAKAQYATRLWNAVTGQLLHTLPGNLEALSPDGSLGLVGGSIWDLRNGRLLQAVYKDLFGRAEAMFSADGTRLLVSGAKSGFQEAESRLWDAHGGLVRTFQHRANQAMRGTTVLFSADGTEVISATDNHITTWDAKTGKRLRGFKAQTQKVLSVAMSHDNTRLLTGSEDKTLKLWDALSGKLLSTLRGHSQKVSSVAFSPDGTRVISASTDGTIRLWDTATGKAIHTFSDAQAWFDKFVFSPDGKRMLSKVFGPFGGQIILWDLVDGRKIAEFSNPGVTNHQIDWTNVVAFSPSGTHVLAGRDRPALLHASTGEVARTFTALASKIETVAASAQGDLVLSAGEDGTIRLWNVHTGRLVRTFVGHSDHVTSAVFSPDGSQILSGSKDGAVTLWETATGNKVLSGSGSLAIVSTAFSPDGRRLLMTTYDDALIWDLGTNAPFRTFKDGNRKCVALSPDGKHILAGNEHTWNLSLNLLEVETGQLVRTFSVEGRGGNCRWVAFSPDGRQILAIASTMVFWDTSTGQRLSGFKEAHKFGDGLAVFSPDSTQLLTAGSISAAAHGDKTLKLWDANTHELLRTFHGHMGQVTSISFSPDGKQVISGSHDTTTRIWSTLTGNLLAVLIGGSKDEWLAATSEGYFAASPNGGEMLSAVRGLEINPLAQLFDQLYRPDLVEEALKGDPLGKHKDAAFNRNLEQLLESGPAPQIEQIPDRKTEYVNDKIKVSLRLVDTGGGIGEKVVWRLNGVTQGDLTTTGGPAPVTRGGFRLVTQTLRVNPARKNIIEVTAYNGAGLLATIPYRIEIDKFGESTERRPRMHVLAIGVSNYARKDWRLRYAASDATAIGRLLESAGKGLYDEVKVTLALDTDATIERIGMVIDRMASEVGADDVFVLFVAGHGRNIAGTYYFLPQDLDFEGGRTVMSHAIAQDKLQEWLAKIPAQKSILILDTCESATATRSLEVEHETAVERLRHATGRSVITAASNAAFEGYEGHGLLTFTILDAFQKQDEKADQEVDLYRLASHVDRTVPLISQRIFGERQRPHHRIEGNFPLGVRLAVSKAQLEAIPKTPTHALIRDERLREKPEESAAGERVVGRGTQVRIVDIVGDWAVVARDGQKLGYVPMEALLRLQ